MTRHDDDLTLTAVEKSLWLGVEAAMGESKFRLGRLPKCRSPIVVHHWHRHRVALAWLGFIAGITLTVGTFTSDLAISIFGVAVLGLAVRHLMSPVSKSFTSAFRRSRQVGE